MSTEIETGVASDAITLLTADHEEVRELFEEYEELVADRASEEDKQELVQQICTMLTIHADLEEEILYPAARTVIDAPEQLDEAVVEHATFRGLIEQLQQSSPDEELYDAKVKVLGEYVEHHVGEEESELFPALREAEVDLDALGAELAERRQELTVEAAAE